MRSLPLASLLVASMAPVPLHAQEPAVEPAQTASRTARPGETPAAAALPEAPAAPATTAPVDTLGGHWTLSLGAGPAVPFGRLQAGLAQSRRIGTGLAFSLSATYGVSRMVALGLWGDAERWSGGTSCDDCSGTGYAAGALAAYHLVQGVRFDPWLAVGLGWRALSVESDSTHLNYAGPEVLRLLVGGDWYATSLLGLGPTVELSGGTYTKRPSDTSRARAHWQLQTTLRVTLDFPGK
jgi:hypothetical protein